MPKRLRNTDLEESYRSFLPSLVFCDLFSKTEAVCAYIKFHSQPIFFYDNLMPILEGLQAHVVKY